ncbi:TPA: XRE family transcriptional regulator [Streptococcus equi subsp. zooepidemicus]|nr:XRE family transcriptional regulator [Streptococcus equi subsp. zooepidemicus]HEL1086887.1 XRE family transcriptional regulator [Streptococcus equi subsp. zooepidemicus]HEL1205407.1 XRE family transcriptional regulator [Streptococcus equi subsp. zooepidemicus]
MEQGHFNPSRLKKARIARGLTKKELAERTGISRQMVSNYELGKTQPGANNLLSLVDELDFPYNYFTSETRSFHEGATFFRSQSASTKRARDMQAVRLEFQKEIYDLLSRYVNFPELILPDVLMKSVYDITDDDIEQKALELRELWGLTRELPIANLIESAEVHGIIVVESNMSNEKLDAVSEWIEDRPFIMLTDNGESAVRRRFNIAHELGHILLHGDVESIHDYTSKELKNIIEKQANYFASCLLLPERGFLNSLLSTNLDFYVELKKYWKISIQAMIMRTYQLDLINDDQKLYLFKKIAFNKWKKKEPLDNELPLEKPSLYRKVFELIVSNDILQKNELISYLSLPKDELEKSLDISIDHDDFSSRQQPILRVVK